MSANLVKIKDIHLYVGLCANGHKCYQAKKLLDTAGIKYSLLGYNDEDQHESVFTSLNTWRWGPERKQRELNQFPLVHWTECFDDFTTHMQVAHGFDEIKASSLLANSKLAG